MKSMKKWLALLLAGVMLVSMAACGGEDEANENATGRDDKIHNGADDTTDANDSSTDNTVVDRYVGFYNLDNRKLYAIKESGSVESIGTAYNPEYSDDGQYLVWKKSFDREPSSLFYKMPDQSSVTIKDNVYCFGFDNEECFLVMFCEDGIYYAENVTATPVKIGDHQGQVERFNIGQDHKNVVYIADGQLHLLSLEKPYSDVVVDDDVEWTEKYVYLSENRIFYTKTDGNTYLWDGSVTTETDLYFENSDLYYWCWENFDNLTLTAISDNCKYIVDRENNGDVYRYEVSEEGLLDKTFIGNAYNKLIWVSDDGTVIFGSGSDDLSVYMNGTLLEIKDAKLPAAAAKYSAPITDGYLYYLSETSLMKLNIEKNEASKVAENVKLFQVCNGYCYYLSDDSLYRTDLDEPINENGDLDTLNGLVG